MPPIPPKPAEQVQKHGSDPPPPFLGPYPDLKDYDRRLNLTIVPLDITEKHPLTRGNFKACVNKHIEAGSPMAEWISAFLTSTFAKIGSLDSEAQGDDLALGLHDPLTVFYVLTHPQTSASPAEWEFSVKEGENHEDIRVETSGQWTRGMMVVDRRARQKIERPDDGEVIGDSGNWLSSRHGNRVRRAVASGKEQEFGTMLFERILGQL